MLTSIWMANDPGAETGVLIMDLFLQWNVATGLSIWSEFNGILWSDNLINANGNMKEWAFLFIGLDLSDLIVDLFRHFPFYSWNNVYVHKEIGNTSEEFAVDLTQFLLIYQCKRIMSTIVKSINLFLRQYPPIFEKNQLPTYMPNAFSSSVLQFLEQTRSAMPF